MFRSQSYDKRICGGAVPRACGCGAAVLAVNSKRRIELLPLLFLGLPYERVLVTVFY